MYVSSEAIFEDSAHQTTETDKNPYGMKQKLMLLQTTYQTNILQSLCLK